MKYPKKTKKPIKYVRFNEVGDFPIDKEQRILDAAALFAQKMKKDYGVQSMAYTANKLLNYKKLINGEPIYKIIKINASRLDIDLGESDRMNFLATPMDFENALYENDKVVSISDSALMNFNYRCEGVLYDPKTNTPSIPVLVKGEWGSGSGWYYVCPCSFWNYNKMKCAIKMLQLYGVLGENVTYKDKTEIQNIIKTLPEDKQKAIKKKLSTIKSPCGVKCAVCHNISGGVSKVESKYGPEEWHMITDYTVLEAVHGSTSFNYNAKYAEAKRRGDDTVKYSDNNPYGLMKKYRK